MLNPTLSLYGPFTFSVLKNGQVILVSRILRGSIFRISFFSSSLYKVFALKKAPLSCVPPGSAVVGSVRDAAPGARAGPGSRQGGRGCRCTLAHGASGVPSVDLTRRAQLAWICCGSF